MTRFGARPGWASQDMKTTLLNRIANGRTDLVFECGSSGLSASATDTGGVSLVRWCGYYGDVSAIRFLMANGESLSRQDGAMLRRTRSYLCNR